MKLRKAIFWQPDVGKRRAIMLAGVVLTLLIDLLHTMAGLHYELHIFFSLPVLLVAWYARAGAGYGVACLVVLLWLIADRMLMLHAPDSLSLLFNLAVRLAMSIGTVWLLTILRRLLNHETQLARQEALNGLKNRHEFFELGRRALAQTQRQRLFAAMRDGDRPVTFSIGVASYRAAPVDLDALLARADGLRYEVKNGGRDRVLLWTLDAGEVGSP